MPPACVSHVSYLTYLPMMGARSCLVFSEMASAWVMIAVASALPHEHPRSAGTRSHRLGDEPLGHLRVAGEVGDDHVHGHAVVIRDASSRSR